MIKLEKILPFLFDLTGFRNEFKNGLNNTCAKSEVTV